MIRIETARQIGAAVRRERIRQGLTQQQLAEAAGVSRALISRLEKGGATALYPEKLLAVLNALGLSLFIEEPASTETTHENDVAPARSTPTSVKPTTTIADLAKMVEKGVELQKIVPTSAFQAAGQLASAAQNYDFLKTSPLFSPHRRETDGGDAE